jgi:hypothetical protein
MEIRGRQWCGWSEGKFPAQSAGVRWEWADDALPGELFECGECSARLEYFVDEKGSPSLKIAEEVAEDWGQ